MLTNIDAAQAFLKIN